MLRSFLTFDKWFFHFDSGLMYASKSFADFDPVLLWLLIWNETDLYLSLIFVSFSLLELIISIFVTKWELEISAIANSSSTFVSFSSRIITLFSFCLTMEFAKCPGTRFTDVTEPVTHVRPRSIPMPQITSDQAQLL